MTQPKIQNGLSGPLRLKTQPPLPGTPYEIPDFLDLLHASGWRIVPGSLRWLPHPTREGWKVAGVEIEEDDSILPGGLAEKENSPKVGPPVDDVGQR